MGITEIVLLLLGLVIFTLSFFIPERKKKLEEQDRRLGQEYIKELVDEQRENVKRLAAEATEETITYAVEKTERAMERLTNEKMMAMNEYSDTVLGEIHKNHEEVVFLYDMLNDKHQNLKDALAEIEEKTREAKEIKEAVEEIKEVRKAAETEEEPEKAEEKSSGFLALQPGKVKKTEMGNVLRVPETMESASGEETETTGKKPRKRTSRKKAKPELAEIFNGAGDMNLSFSDEGKNNNEKILALHRAGKSNMAIAKELGLGIGEVKLVIDLFRGV